MTSVYFRTTTLSLTIYINKHYAIYKLHKNDSRTSCLHHATVINLPIIRILQLKL
jgi:hypothetical protein